MAHSRREFLQSALGSATLLALAPAVPNFLARTALAAPEGAADKGGETVLVVVQLAGGNDGLNTVVPYEDDVYGRARPTLRLTKAAVHEIGDDLGFHPEMKTLVPLLKEGRLSVVQGVGYSGSDRNHPTAMRVWHTAKPVPPGAPGVIGDTAQQTGWLGRAADGLRTSGVDLPAVHLGEIPVPFALNGERTIVPWIKSDDAWAIGAAGGDAEAQHARLARAAQAPRSGDNPLVAMVQDRTLAAYDVSRQVQSVAAAAEGDYPKFQLAERLRAVARLVRARVGIRIYYTELGGPEPGGFDTHAGQGLNHGALLRQLSDSVAAFAKDLARDGTLDRVLLMTFSEFGRTLSENGRRGTNHGDAQPIFLVGGKLQGGLVGKQPSLTELEGDAPKHHTDFRRVYATALESWLGFNSRVVLGETFQPLDVLRS